MSPPLVTGKSHITRSLCQKHLANLGFPRLFNFALGLFIPPAFRNILWKSFIIFGVLCLAAAVQFYFTYPETCQKTIEEVEWMFSPAGPHPWNTKKGGSRLDQEVAEVLEAREKGRSTSIAEVIEKHDVGNRVEHV